MTGRRMQAPAPRLCRGGCAGACGQRGPHRLRRQVSRQHIDEEVAGGRFQQVLGGHQLQGEEGWGGVGMV